MSKTKILIIMVFMFVLGVNAFAAFPVVTGDEPEPPKVVITENDKMNVIYRGITNVPYFIFLGKEYGYKNNFKEVSLLFEVAGMHEWYKNLQNAYARRNNRQDWDDYINQSVKRFNDFLAQSQENRDKFVEITDIINQKLKQEWEEKREKKQKELEEEKQNTERAKNSKLLLFHFFGSFNFADTRGTGHIDFTMMPGLRFSYYFLNPLSSINIGIGAQFSYLMFGKKYADAEYFETGILCSMKLKFSSVSNFVLNMGFSLLNHMSSKAETISIKEFNKTVPAFALEIGYLFISKSQRFTFFFNLSVLYAKFYKEYNYNMYIDFSSWQNKPGLMYGVSMGIGFNLL